MQGSEIMGVLLVPSSSPTLSPIYDVLDASMASNITWFHLNHDIVSRRIYKLSFYGGHSITLSSVQRQISYAVPSVKSIIQYPALNRLLSIQR